jgi:hypothetical protein
MIEDRRDGEPAAPASWSDDQTGAE